MPKGEKHSKSKKKAEPEEALPGTAGMGQGQPGAGVDAPDKDMPEQADALATGGEALLEQQTNPDLKDNNGVGG